MTMQRQFSYSYKWEFSDVIKIIHLIDVIYIVILYNYYSTTFGFWIYSSCVCHFHNLISTIQSWIIL